MPIYGVVKKMSQAKKLIGRKAVKNVILNLLWLHKLFPLLEKVTIYCLRDLRDIV